MNRQKPRRRVRYVPNMQPNLMAVVSPMATNLLPIVAWATVVEEDTENDEDLGRCMVPVCIDDIDISKAVIFDTATAQWWCPFCRDGNSLEEARAHLVEEHGMDPE